MTTFISFAQRQNDDRSLDSTCTRCYETVARGLSEAETAQAEAEHQCDSEAWKERSQLEMSPQHLT